MALLFAMSFFAVIWLKFVICGNRNYVILELTAPLQHAITKERDVQMFSDYITDDRQLLELLRNKKCTGEEIEYILSDDESGTDKDSTYNSNVRKIFIPVAFQQSH